MSRVNSELITNQLNLFFTLIYMVVKKMAIVLPILYEKI